jgi:ABC-2 type transport system ATP-binding protein
MLNFRNLATIVAFCALPSITACGGGGATTGPGPGAIAPTSASASATPHTTPASSPTPITTASSAPSSSMSAPTSPPLSAADTSDAIPATPAPGQCRAGQTYNEYVTTNDAGSDTEAFTVFEPAQICGGKTYPVVMWGPGYSASRQTSDTSNVVSNTENDVSPGNIASLVNADYGVISIDERGFGQDSGTVRVMDPNFEGFMDLSAMDWAQANLSWLAYAPTLEGDDAHEPVMGAIGGSYGGMYQKMLLNLDKRHRLRAIVPQIAPNDLNYSLFPNGVVKSAWDLDLFALGESGGSSNTGYAHEDPFLKNAVVGSIEADSESQAVHDFFGYHSSSYFCNQQAIASDGDAGSSPLWAPTKPPKINALLFQGIRDTLFTANNAWGDEQCWSQGGGDVRMLTYNYGHNFLQVVPDPYLDLYYGDPQAVLDENCGSTNVDTATLAFFNQYLKGQANAASAIPTMPCWEMGDETAVLTPTILHGKTTTAYTIPSTTAIAGAGLDVPTAIPLGSTFATPAIVAGFPHMAITVTPIASGTEPFLFLGIGQMHASKPGAWDLVDNQLTPISGAGTFDLDMTGIATKLAAGDQLALLVYGEEDQYDSDSADIAAPAVVPVTVTGNVWIPFAPNAVSAP